MNPPPSASRPPAGTLISTGLNLGLWHLQSAFLPLLALTVAFYAPLYLALLAVRLHGDWPAEAVDQVFGVAALALLPVTSGAVMALLHGRAASGGLPAGPTSIPEALATALGCWPRLLAAYVFLGFALLAALAVGVLPPGLVVVILTQRGIWPQSMIWALAPFGALAVLAVIPRYALLDPLIVLGGHTAYGARVESRRLLRPLRWQVSGLWLLLTAPVLALDVASTFLGETLGGWSGWPAPVWEAVLGMASALLYLAPYAVFYGLWRVLATPEARSGKTATGARGAPVTPVRGV